MKDSSTYEKEKKDEKVDAKQKIENSHQKINHFKNKVTC